MRTTTTTTTVVVAAADQLADIAPAAVSPAGAGAKVRQRGGWLRRRLYYAPVGADEQGVAGAPAAAADDGAAAQKKKKKKHRRGGWLRRLLPRSDHAAASTSGLLSGLPRWKRLSVSGGWASALLDAASFRVMYVVEAVVLGLALSCFFCCCGCQI